MLSIRCIATSTIVVLAACRVHEPAASAPRDVVLVTLDTTRADRLGVYGNPRPTTPVLDAFAREATVFEHAYSTSSWTLPAHASMFTGRSPRAHGADNDATGNAHLSQQITDPSFVLLRANALGDEQTTLAEVLTSHGYATGAFAGGPWLAPRFGALQGFETADADADTIGGRPADVVTDRALVWAGGVPAERPLFLFVNYFDAHQPYEPPPGYAELARGSDAPGRWDAYDGEIRFADAQLGRLLDGLRALGRYDGALIAVTADHGEMFGEHGAVGHANWLWEELIHVPLVVRQRGAHGGGARRSEPVSVADLPALVAEHAGIALPASFESLAVGKREDVLAEVNRLQLSIRLQGPELDRDLAAVVRWPWKLIADSRGSEALYELTTDPREQREIATAAPKRTLALRTRLDAARARMQPPPRTPISVDGATHERLRELGYTE